MPQPTDLHMYWMERQLHYTMNLMKKNRGNFFPFEMMKRKKLSFLAVKCIKHFTAWGGGTYTPKKLCIVHVYKRKNHMGIWDLQHRSVHSATLIASTGTIQKRKITCRIEE